MNTHRILFAAASSCVTAGLVLACTSSDSSPTPGGTLDSGRPDVGAVDGSSHPAEEAGGGSDSSTDTGALDTGALDTGAGDDGGSDATVSDADAGACGVGAPTDVVAYWAAEGNANDSTGNHNGTLADAGVTFGTGPAGLGQAFSFDGVSGFVGLPDGIIPVSTTGFTLAAWFNPTALPTSDASNSNALVFYGGANAGEYQLNVSSDGTVSCGLKLSDANWYWASSAAGAGSAGAWHLAICVLDGAPLDGGASVDGGSSLQIVVDGKAAGGSIPSLALYQTGGFPSSIGTYAQDLWGTGASFHGLVDDVRLYTRALTPGEVQGFAQGCTLP